MGGQLRGACEGATVYMKANGDLLEDFTGLSGGRPVVAFMPYNGVRRRPPGTSDSTLPTLTPAAPLCCLCLLATGKTGLDVVTLLSEILEHSRALDLPPKCFDRPLDAIAFAYDEFAHMLPF